MYLVKKYYLESLIVVVLCSFFSWILYHTAWIGDDMFISLRQVWNFINGDGFVYNYDQRVQAFTHPAWVLLLSFFSFITHELFYTTVFVSIFLSLGALLILFMFAKKVAGPDKLALLFYSVLIAMLGFSQGFTDYMTSGLENPLSFFVIGLLIYIVGFNKKEYSYKHAAFIFVLLAIAFLNRFDYAVLLAPLVVYLGLFVFGFKHALKSAIAGLIMIVSWFVFSIIYFGAPFPNTYYAKLGTQYPKVEVYERGWNYFEVTFAQDPMTLFIILGGILIGLFSKNYVFKSLALGLVLYCLYIIKSGGDFMMGRFFSVPVFISIFIIIANAKNQFKSPVVFLSGSLLCCLVLNFDKAPILHDVDYINKDFEQGVADERGFYFQRWGLNAPNRNWPKPVVMGDKPKKFKTLCGGMGVNGLEKPEMYLIDVCGLTDALTSRLPAVQSKGWRIGHHGRKIPTNYPDYLLEGVSVVDESLHSILDDITLIVSGDLFTLERFKAIYRMNVSKPYEVNYELYKDPKSTLPVSNLLQEFNYNVINHRRVADSSSWNAPGNIIINSGIMVKFDEPINASRVYFSLDHNDRYLLIVNDNPPIKVRRPANSKVKYGMQNYSYPLNRNEKIEKIQLIIDSGDGAQSLGHFLVR